jgi:outer membrane lipoprotein-sorting protein
MSHRKFMNFAVFAIALSVCPSILGDAAQAQSAAEILQKTRSTYQELKSYSDAGTVVSEYGVSSEDRHSFSTYFNRAPRHFLLDFRKQGGDRFVIWGDPDAFHTWWKTTVQQMDYPNPNNIAAISMSGQNTAGTALKIPTLLYGKSPLAAAMLNVANPVLQGSEEIAGRRCHKITGQASDVYTATGREVNVRAVTVWIDAESYLVRKVLEEWKPLPGQRNRLITTFDPQANPALDEARFRFTQNE